MARFRVPGEPPVWRPVKWLKWTRGLDVASKSENLPATELQASMETVLAELAGQAICKASLFAPARFRAMPSAVVFDDEVEARDQPDDEGGRALMFQAGLSAITLFDLDWALRVDHPTKESWKAWCFGSQTAFVAVTAGLSVKIDSSSVDRKLLAKIEAFHQFENNAWAAFARAKDLGFADEWEAAAHEKVWNLYFNGGHR